MRSLLHEAVVVAVLVVEHEVFFSSNRGTTARCYSPRNNNSQRNIQGNGERSVLYVDRIICQICDKPRHPALNCYQGMNVAFEGRIPAKRISAMTSSPITLNKQQNGAWLFDIGANAHLLQNFRIWLILRSTMIMME